MSAFGVGARAGSVRPTPLYRIVRIYRGSDRREEIATGLTLAEAQAHCSDPETSSTTATSDEARETTEAYGEWMDVYYEEAS